jgi:nucleotide-binding universal stress UspA family protein
MYNHILIPTDGSELSSMAIYEGVALAKALGARVTVVTVTTPFRVFTADPTMITDTPDQYKEHMAAVGGQYLDVAKKIAKAAGVTCDLVHLDTTNLIKRLSTQRRNEDATRSIWPRMDDAGYPRFCSAARPLRC